MNQQIKIRPRELEVAKWVAAGYTTKQIAAIWHIDFTTVKTHRENIMAATHTENLIAAIVVLHQNHIIDLHTIKVLRTSAAQSPINPPTT